MEKPETGFKRALSGRVLFLTTGGGLYKEVEALSPEISPRKLSFPFLVTSFSWMNAEEGKEDSGQRANYGSELSNAKNKHPADNPGFNLSQAFFETFFQRKGNHASIGTGIFRSNFLWRVGSEMVNLAMGSPCSIQDSTIFRATSSAISMTSAIVLPCAINPCNAELVAKYPLSSNGSMEMGIKYSDIGSPLDKNYHREGILSSEIRTAPAT